MRNNNNNNNAVKGVNSSIIPRNTEEIPIAAHIFEGHLYIKDAVNNKWLWRLFRFDGTSLACLSSKKIKLPPHTQYSPTVDYRYLSFPTIPTSITSRTSPLFATPKDKSARLINASTQKDSSSTNARYYQLPKWTIDIINISSISILKSNTTHKSFKHPFSNNSCNSKCFSIRTYSGECYVMKAHKHNDLERWTFVLSKMWKFTQSARELYHQPLRPQSNSFSSLNQPCHAGTTPNIMKSNPDQMISALPVAQHTFIMENTSKEAKIEQYQQSNLSNEKVLWIEEWIKSLEELAENDEFSCMENTSVLYKSHSIALSKNKPELKRRSSIRHRKYKSLTNKPAMSEQGAIVQPHQPKDETNTDSFELLSNKNCLNFFQDVHTVYSDDECLNKEYKHHSLTYHNLIREQRVKIIENENRAIEEKIKVTPPLHLMYTDASFKDDYSPLENLKNKVNRVYNSTSDINKDKLIMQQPSKIQNDENICLADVRKSLQNMNINNKKQVQPSYLDRPQSIFDAVV